MTTDPFTQAAWAEVKRRTRPSGISGQTVPSIEQDAERDGYRRGFMDAAEWARAYLAAQEPTKDEAYAAYVEWDLHVAYGERGALRCHCGAPGVWGTTAAHEQHALWHALSAAREVRP